MTEPNATNGHPPTKPPPQREEPSPREPTRHLVVDVRDGDLLLDSVEPTQDDVILWLRSNGGTDLLTSGELGELAAMTVEPEPVRLTGAERGTFADVSGTFADPAGKFTEPERSEKAGAKLPSERIVELHRENEGMQIEPGSLAERCGWQVALVAMFLDEQWRERGGR
jgi:hypothetical protein